MFGVIQFIRNSFIRLEGFLYQLFGFIRKIFSQIFGFLARIFGFTQPGYFLESDDATTIKRSQIKQPTETEVKVTPETSLNPRRRPDPKMDYFRKMAQDMKKS
ncbi:threonine dehydratase [Chlorogloeopsis fritschii PCC 9212]|uniref:Threonine dehydratase n=1 Tax=Chlorogloeopsis fritschii PCC 6912 TaxID=211165 RepID=A0A433MWM5_CHLFR|nr:hypothetical protein [Chlorogloeopsis fritschii]MBF2005319.1 threonine dehydratase [Chlorogloeopsis fritschii C42_A2020_084]RUR72376.1 hypothetical protein PCC6912_63540 [Chlorogloeopsis fritschii PCC 6912]